MKILHEQKWNLQTSFNRYIPFDLKFIINDFWTRGWSWCWKSTLIWCASCCESTVTENSILSFTFTSGERENFSGDWSLGREEERLLLDIKKTYVSSNVLPDARSSVPASTTILKVLKVMENADGAWNNKIDSTIRHVYLAKVIVRSKGLNQSAKESMWS